MNEPNSAPHHYNQSVMLYSREAVDKEINQMAARKLRISARKAAAELERIGQRFFSLESPLRRGCDQAVELILKDYSQLVPGARGHFNAAVENYSQQLFTEAKG